MKVVANNKMNRQSTNQPGPAGAASWLKPITAVIALTIVFVAVSAISNLTVAGLSVFFLLALAAFIWTYLPEQNPKP